MTKAQMIAKAWLDEEFRASLAAQGVEVPPRPADLADDQLDILSDIRQHDIPGLPAGSTTG